jgi:hypothetical protein
MHSQAYQIHSIAWTVLSATTPGIVYTVSAASPDASLACNCEANDYPKTRGKCWHLKAVHSGMAGKPRCRVSAAVPAFAGAFPVGELAS